MAILPRPPLLPCIRHIYSQDFLPYKKCPSSLNVIFSSAPNPLQWLWPLTRTVTQSLVRLFFNSIFKLFCPITLGFLRREIRVAFPREKPAATEWRYPQPTVHAGCFQCFDNLPNSDIDYRIHVERTDVHTRNCTRGCTDVVKSLHWKSALGEKSLAAPGNRTCVSGVPVGRSSNWATSPPLAWFDELAWHVLCRIALKEEWCL